MSDYFFVRKSFIISLRNIEGKRDMSVYNVLFPPDEKYKSMINISTRTKQKEMKSLGCCYFEDIENYIGSLKILKSNDYYITKNGLQPYSKRCSERLYTLNNVCLDIDFHGNMNPYERTNCIDEFIFRIKRDLFNIQPPFNIFKPSVLVRTGRGCQLWWHINSASVKLLFVYNSIIDKLAVIIKDFLTEYTDLEQRVEIDVSASKNAVGLCRLMGAETWNSHTQTKVEHEIISTASYDINDFNKALSEHPSYKEYELKKLLKKQAFEKRSHASRKGRTTQKERNPLRALHMKRLAFIKWVSQTLLDSVGKRNTMLFLAYNSAVQVMPIIEAQNFCKELNKTFSEPLKKIDYIFKGKKTYKLTNKRFYEMLSVQEDEIKHFKDEYKKQSVNLTRNAQIKERMEKQQQKKGRALQLLAEGMTFKGISAETGLSVATISRLSKENGLKLKKEKPWESLGMSKATYYRKKKLL